MKFAGVTLTDATIEATRQWFADNSRACIKEARESWRELNDLEGLCAFHEQAIIDSMAGKHDHSFAFLQRAHFIQTGECIPLLKPPASSAPGEHHPSGA